MNRDHINDRDWMPPALDQLRDCWEQWRRQNGPGHRRRIPPELWEKAAVLAREQGVFKVAQTLRLNYATLKQRARVPADKPRSQTPGPFVELVLPDSRGRSADVIELVNRQGARLTLRLQSPWSQALLDLAEVFLRSRK